MTAPLLSTSHPIHHRQVSSARAQHLRLAGQRHVQRNPPEKQVLDVTEGSVHGTASSGVQAWHSHVKLTHGQFKSPELDKAACRDNEENKSHQTYINCSVTWSCRSMGKEQRCKSVLANRNNPKCIPMCGGRNQYEHRIPPSK